MSAIEYIKARCNEDADCWIWPLACSGNGTPKVTIGARPERKQWAVRRLIATEMGLQIDGMLVTNTCGDPLCVCPDHVLVVTKKEMATLITERTGHPYRIERRAKIAATQRARLSKLTPEVVAEIRASNETHAQIAERLCVSKRKVGAIRRHEAWKDYSSPFAGLGAR